MRILSIDTSQPHGSVALTLGEGKVETASFGASSTHLVGLNRSVRALLRENGARVSDIDRLALVSGPGSFTGLRVGLAFVKGLYAALGLDVVAMSSLELLALQGAAGHERVCPMIDARRDEVYAAVYARARGHGPLAAVESVVEPAAKTPAAFVASLDVSPTVFIGSGALRYRPLIEAAFAADASFVEETANRPSTALLCRHAAVLTPLSPDEILLLEPYYIRASDAKLRPLGKIRTHDED